MIVIFRWLMILLFGVVLSACGQGTQDLVKEISGNREYPIAIALKNYRAVNGHYTYEATIDGQLVKIIVNYEQLPIDNMEAVLDIANLGSIDLNPEDELKLINTKLDLYVADESVSSQTLRYYNNTMTRPIMSLSECDEYLSCEEYDFAEAWHEPPEFAKIGESGPYYTSKNYSNPERTDLLDVSGWRWELRAHPDDPKSKKALFCILMVDTNNEKGFGQNCSLIDEQGHLEPYNIYWNGVVFKRVHA